MVRVTAGRHTAITVLHSIQPKGEMARAGIKWSVVKTLSSNSDLYQYLLELSALLRSSGLVDLADIVRSASRQSAAMSTEFLGESRIALRQVWSHGQTALSEQGRIDLMDVLKQLNKALHRH
jgi:hypothetical protein